MKVTICKKRKKRKVGIISYACHVLYFEGDYVPTILCASAAVEMKKLIFCRWKVTVFG